MKRVGAKRHPCIPVRMEKGYVSVPLMMAVAILLAWICFRIVMNLHDNQIWSRLSRETIDGVGGLSQVNESHV